MVMKTRQLRLNDEQKIREKTPELKGKELHIVLRDRTVLLGTVSKVNSDTITLKNLRRAQQVIPYSNISEIYFDTKE
jgi:hypothetical protein